MPKTTALSLQLLVLCAGLSLSVTALGAPRPSLTSRAERVQDALTRRGAELQARFAHHEAAWPPRGLFLRAFKGEMRLELWASAREGHARVKVYDWAICAQSGALGPKRREGDGQIPEGVYTIARFNPLSRFHLSMGLNYPNAADRARAGEGDPGSDIFIHGDCVSVGCLAIRNGPVELLYLAAAMAREGGQRRIPAHLFPCRFGALSCEGALEDGETTDPELAILYKQLRLIYAAFERTRSPPHVRVHASGYTLR